MKTQPDETSLTLWMDGQLQGEDLHRMEAWAKENPELLADRDAVQSLSQTIKDNIPAHVEPPYSDFLNQRIMQAIQQYTPAPPLQPSQTSSNINRSRPRWPWLLRWLTAPLAAGAMALCFYLGTQVSPNQLNNNSHSTTTAAVNPTVYTPDKGVEANIYVDDVLSATVIVIEGLEDIPDNLEMVGCPAMDHPNRFIVSSE